MVCAAQYQSFVPSSLSLSCTGPSLFLLCRPHATHVGYSHERHRLGTCPLLVRSNSASSFSSLHASQSRMAKSSRTGSRVRRVAPAQMTGSPSAAFTAGLILVLSMSACFWQRAFSQCHSLPTFACNETGPSLSFRCRLHDAQVGNSHSRHRLRTLPPDCFRPKPSEVSLASHSLQG